MTASDSNLPHMRTSKYDVIILMQSQDADAEQDSSLLVADAAVSSGPGAIGGSGPSGISQAIKCFEQAVELQPFDDELTSMLERLVKLQKLEDE